MKIDLGKVTLIKRAKIKPPNDGIHRAGKEGFIKGVHSVMSSNYGLIPKGSVGFFIDNGDGTGVKVYIGGFPDKPWVSKKRVVQKAFKNMVQLSLAGLAPGPKHVVSVQVKYIYKGKTQSIKAYGLHMEKCHYPIVEWNAYSEGLPYKFTDHEDHPNHSPEGYFEFCERLRTFCASAKIVLSCFDYRKKGDRVKLGDVLYCIGKKNWFVVDGD